MSNSVLANTDTETIIPIEFYDLKCKGLIVFPECANETTIVWDTRNIVMHM